MICEQRRCRSANIVNIVVYMVVIDIDTEQNRQSVQPFECSYSICGRATDLSRTKKQIGETKFAKILRWFFMICF